MFELTKLYEEITRQYGNLDKTVTYFESQKAILHSFFQKNSGRSLLFLGSGSSYNLARSAELIARNRYGLQAMSVPAGDAMVNFETAKKAFVNSIAVAITRSGSTTEILKTAGLLQRELNVPVISITCVEQSELNRTAELSLSLPWAFDESVCQTGTVSILYSAAALLLGAFAGDDSLYEEFRKAAASGDAFVHTYESDLQKIAGYPWSKAVVLADGEISGVSSEAALAFKEISRTDSNFYHVLDVRHGPMVMIGGDTLVLVALKPDNKAYQLNLVEDLVRKGAKVVVCTDDSYAKIPDVLLHARHKSMGTIAAGLPFLNLAQYIAYYRALNKGVDPANPEGLDAWIKLA